MLYFIIVVHKLVLMQQRFNGTSDFFNRTWAEYKAGFGDPNGEYWIGLDSLHELTSTGLYKLRADLQAENDSQCYWEEFDTFIVGDEASGYLLTVDTTAGSYTGTAGVERLPDSNVMKF